METTSPTRLPAWTYGFWGVVGGLMSIGIVGLLTIGIVFLAAATLLGIFGLRAKALNNASTKGMIVGLAVAPLYLAWLNREGPGTVCKGTSCEDMYSPWPFLAVAVAFVIGFVVAVRAG